MSLFETASITEAYRGTCQDRVAVFERADRLVIVAADGAGGSGDGAQAAAQVVQHVESRLPATKGPDAWSEVLKEADLAVAMGESTGVVVDLTADGTCGASVGDSRAWIIRGTQIEDLTAKQRRKPLLGSGEASPVGFTHSVLAGLLIVGTDGFCNYVKQPPLVKAVEQFDLTALPRRLVELVRLPSGNLWDDVGIVICRRKPCRPFGRIELALEDIR